MITSNTKNTKTLPDNEHRKCTQYKHINLLLDEKYKRQKLEIQLIWTSAPSNHLSKQGRAFVRCPVYRARVNLFNMVYQIIL